MKMRIRDIILIALVAVLSFPLMYLAIMFFTGNARIEFTRNVAVEKEEQHLKTIRHSQRRDSLAILYLQSYQAMQRENEEVEKERKKLQEQQERIHLVSSELEEQRDFLAAERQKIETLVSQSDSLETKRIKQLSRVYGAMKAGEAASILQTLDDDLVIQILNGINDDRQRAKIVAALPTQQASRISRKMGQL
jgi:flagellar motility protein MotE (MotC chaperone)